MIFNRTQNDVDTAIILRREKVQTFQELTESEIETLEKGTMTINTLNRIESKQAEVKTLLNNEGYFNTQIINKSWSEEDIFDSADFERLVNNDAILRDAFYVYSTTPLTPLPEYYYENINALEKILVDLETMIDDVKNHYRECGTFECGEENIN